MSAQLRPYGFYSTAPVPFRPVAESEIVWYGEPLNPSKRGPKPTPDITVGMYFDYCTGMTLEGVARKWGCSYSTICRRFKAMRLPSRPSQLAPLKHGNRERTRVAAAVTVECAKDALHYCLTPHARGILQLRIDYPDATLSELAAMHEPPLTKHTVSAVLRRARVRSGCVT